MYKNLNYRSKAPIQNIPKQEENNTPNQEIEKLKTELNKNMVYLTNLKEEYKIKKREVEMMPKSTTGNATPQVVKSEKKENGFSLKIVLLSLLVSVLLGFYLSK